MIQIGDTVHFVRIRKSGRMAGRGTDPVDAEVVGVQPPLPGLHIKPLLQLRLIKSGQDVEGFVAHADHAHEVERYWIEPGSVQADF